MNLQMKIVTTMLVLLISASAAWAGGAEYVFTATTEKSAVNSSGDSVTIDGGQMIADHGAPALGYRVLKIALPSNTRLQGISVQASSPQLIGRGEVGFVKGDLKTGDYPQETVSFPSASIYDSDSLYPGLRAVILDSGYWGDLHIADVAVYPLAYRPLSRELMLFGEITIRFNLEPAALPNGLDARPVRGISRLLPQMIDNAADLPGFYSPGPDRSPMELGFFDPPVFLIITTAEIAPGFYPFLEWKNQKGVRTDMALVEDILASTSGVDPAEQLRNYLIEAYNSGIRFVLLGGDEDAVPIRYLYPNNVNGSIPELHLQQISDLYFADLTGDWDTDGDGVWGESYNDNGDFYPELSVGRVPARSPEQAQAWSRKAILYEKDPGNGDPSYLTKALFITADQMRDMNQHIVLSGMVPTNFLRDNFRLAEEPSGNDDYPTQPLAETVIDVMQEGWGFISNLNHGDFCWYASQTSGYNRSNRSGVWGDTVVWEGCGALKDLTTFDQPSVQYSISCDLGAFDYDKGIFFPGPYISPYCFMESFMFEPGSGVAFLGNTRWGWVSASYNLERKFVGHVFADSTNNLFLAETLSKLEYPNYRDICYGHNLFGDPETSLWLEVDGRLEINGPELVSLNTMDTTFVVTISGEPISGARVCAYMAGSVFEVGYTDADGEVTLELNLQDDGYMTVTATKPNYIPKQKVVRVGDPMGVDDEVEIPDNPFVFQNYPNPFNPSTTIRFDLSQQADASLTIYDIQGRLVRNLADGNYPAGQHSVTWNGENNSGGSVSSGVYFYRFESGTTSEIKRMTVLR